MAIDASFPKQLYLMQIAVMPPPQNVPFPCYLIQTSDGRNILIDSGLPSSNYTLPAGMPTPIKGKNVLEQLAMIGLRPEDIEILICTHFDGDHAGNHAAFPNAQLVVQRQHYDVARSGHPRFAGVRSQWDLPASRYRLVDGDLELLPGLELIETSGHVPGHQSVIVRLPQNGPVLLTIDAVDSQRDFSPDHLPSPRDMDQEGLVASTRKLLDLAQKEHVSLVIFGHDGQQWSTLKKLPEYYD